MAEVTLEVTAAVTDADRQWARVALGELAELPPEDLAPLPIPHPAAVGVIEHQRRLYEDLRDTNRSIRNRATAVAGISTGLFAALVVAGGYVAVRPVVTYLVVAVFMVAFLLVVMIARDMADTTRRAPGGTDWGRIWSDYLNGDPDRWVTQIVAELVDSAAHEASVNRMLSLYARWQTACLVVQATAATMFVLSVYT